MKVGEAELLLLIPLRLSSKFIPTIVVEDKPELRYLTAYML